MDNYINNPSTPSQDFVPPMANPQSPFWKWSLGILALVFVGIIIDYVRTSHQPKPLEIVFLIIFCAVLFGLYYLLQRLLIKAIASGSYVWRTLPGLLVFAALGWYYFRIIGVILFSLTVVGIVLIFHKYIRPRLSTDSKGILKLFWYWESMFDKNVFNQQLPAGAKTAPTAKQKWIIGLLIPTVLVFILIVSWLPGSNLSPSGVDPELSFEIQSSFHSNEYDPGKDVVLKVDGDYAFGESPTNRWIAMKENMRENRDWRKIWEGQESPLCEDVDKYNVPKTIYGDCYENEGKLRYGTNFK